MDATYPPLSKVRRTLKVRWYRCPIDKEELRQLMQRSDLRGAFQAVGHLALWGATGTAAFLCFHHQLWIGFAVALDEGLIVPVLRNAEQIPIKQLAIDSAELARKAREGGLTPDEWRDELAGWRELGATITFMTPEHHDQVLAQTSHLPHLLAYALVDTLSLGGDSLEVFQSLHVGKVTAINATVATWENFGQTMDHLAAWSGRFDSFGDILVQVQSTADILRAKEEGRVGIILGFQNASPSFAYRGRVY